MKNRLFSFNKGFLINQLMQVYSLILIMVITFIMIGLSLFVVTADYKNAQKTVENVSTELGTNLNSKDQNVVSNILSEVAVSPSKYENLYNYLTMSQEDYMAYMINSWHETGVSSYFPDIMRTFFLNYSEVSSIDIVLDDEDVYLHGDRVSIMGKKIAMPYHLLDDELTLVRALRDPSTSQIKGTIYVTFTNESLSSFYNDNQKDQEIVSNFIFNSHDELIFEDSQGLSEATVTEIEKIMLEKSWLNERDLNNRYLVRSLSVKDMTLLTVLDKQKLRKDSLLQLVPIILIGLTVMVLLLVILNKVFKKYSHQMSEIVKVTNQVSLGNLEAQVNTDHMELELKDLAEAINQMVINLNKYIEDIYLLEIKQRDAHMSALQSQINPHFLYNTLEYIRMYALNKQQTELADVVYAFSALLRNNINQEKTTTLKEELDFCEKYVYLFQMRYPDSIAYNFVVDDGLDKFVIPKFIIQPLIENYFIHGIDYERQDNAISVKAHRYDEEVVIQIVDNGLGIEAQRLIEINDKLHRKGQKLPESIGMTNVYERIKGFFGEDSQMWIESEMNQGTTIMIKIKAR